MTTLLDVPTTKNPDGEHSRPPDLTPAEIQELTAYVRSLWRDSRLACGALPR